MAILTWRDVAGPNFSGASQSLATAAGLFDRAGQGLQSAVTGFDRAQSAGANQQALLNMLQHTNRADYEQALTSGALVSGLDPKRLSVDTLTALAERSGQLQRQQVVDQTMQHSKYDQDRKVEINQQTDAARAPFNAELIRTTGNQGLASLAGLTPSQQSTMASTMGTLGVQAREQEQALLDKQRLDQTNQYVAQGMQLASPDQARAFLATIQDPYVKNAVYRQLSGNIPGIYGPNAQSSEYGSVGAAPVTSIGAVGAGSAPNYAAAVQQNPNLPQFIEGLAKLETAGGSKTVKGAKGEDSFNLFNIKDFSKEGTGFRAKDAAEDSNDRYRVYSNAEESKADLISLLAQRYPKALTARTGAEFAAALKEGGYATDPNYVDKLTKVIGSPAQTAADNTTALINKAFGDKVDRSAVPAPVDMSTTAQAISTNSGLDAVADMLTTSSRKARTDGDPQRVGEYWKKYGESEKTVNEVISEVDTKKGLFSKIEPTRLAALVSNYSREFGTSPELTLKTIERSMTPKSPYPWTLVGAEDLGGQMKLDNSTIRSELMKYTDSEALKRSANNYAAGTNVEAVKTAQEALKKQRADVTRLAKLATTSPAHQAMAVQETARLKQMEADAAALFTNLQNELNRNRQK